MPLASIFFLILPLLRLKLFSTVKGIIAVFSPSFTYLHLLFILLLCISQQAASVKQLFWPPPNTSAAVGVVWRSSTVAGFQSFWLLPLTLIEIKIYCPGDGASGSSRKSLGRRACSSPSIEDIFFEKWQPLLGHARLQQVLCSMWTSKSFFLPIDMDYILAEVPMTGC